MTSVYQEEIETCRKAVQPDSSEEAIGTTVFLDEEADKRMLIRLFTDTMIWRFDPANYTIWYSLGPPNRPWPNSSPLIAEAEAVVSRPQANDATLARISDEVSSILESLPQQEGTQMPLEPRWMFIVAAVLAAALLGSLAMMF